MSRSRSVGVTVFGVLLVVSSAIMLPGYFWSGYRPDQYKIIHQSLPEWLIVIRYIVSCGLRIVGLVSGIGILYLNDVFRKIAIGLGIFVMSTIFFKHPFHGFSVQADKIEELVFLIRELGFYSVSASMVTWGLVILVSLIDFVFAASIVYFFTRPKVKKQFQ